MSTYMPKLESIERKWYILDAAGKPLGRVAVQAANLLRGKHKALFAQKEKENYENKKSNRPRACGGYGACACIVRQ